MARAKMTKREAVRQSLAELGHDAKPAEMQADILGRFGIRMTTDHISTEKGNLLRKARAGAGVRRGRLPGASAAG